MRNVLAAFHVSEGSNIVESYTIVRLLPDDHGVRYLPESQEVIVVEHTKWGNSLADIAVESFEEGIELALHNCGWGDYKLTKGEQ